MNRTAIQEKVLALLVDLAPEFTADEIDLDEDLREQLDIDSMDLHNFAVQVFETFEIDVPEADFAELTTVSRCVAYLERRSPG